MIVTSVKTHKITARDTDLLKILDKYLLKVEERSIIAITSKIVSICEGQLVKIGQGSKGSWGQKDELIEREAQYFLPRSENKYGVSLTITNNTLVATSGIDESNGNGYYILWPKDPQKTANRIRLHLMSRCNLRNIGIIITDSRTVPLRWGVTAFALVYSGFLPLENYIGKPDLFGRKFEFEQMSIIDNLACAAAVVMGEGAEQTPMAVITDLPFVQFQDRNPTEKELDALKISMDKDLYGPFLKSVKWRKGFAKQNSDA
ncbi:coenzyme F420-0:L-glutamate ligase [Candidatus Microgenomates bacterium]|nr:coenzyme F420-0:L-glutamate ligase [Candidatus Microgenomates bacterium]